MTDNDEEGMIEYPEEEDDNIDLEDNNNSAINSASDSSHNCNY